jgi:hypothetical protein
MITPAQGTFTFSPAPSGFPIDPGGANGGSPRAACVMGTTGARQYATEGLGLVFAIVPNPDGGVATSVPLDAHQYTGIRFWAWGAQQLGTQTLILDVPDRNETPGLGPPGAKTVSGTYCDPSSAASVTSCGGATNNIRVQPGWQLVQVPFVTLADNPYYGGANEGALDPTGLTQIHWQVQEPVPDAGAGVTFDFCIAYVSFY